MVCVYACLLSCRRVHYLVLELFVDTAAAFAAAAQSLTTEDVSTNNFMQQQQQQLSAPPLPQLQQRLYGPVGGSMPATTNRFLLPPTVAVQQSSLYQVPVPIHPGYGAANPPPGYQGFNINSPRLIGPSSSSSSSSDPSSSTAITSLKSYSVMSYNTIPFAVLGNYGVGNDLLRQLMELKANLNSNVS